MFSISTELAVEVFVKAFCRSKSRTHPYIPEKHGDIWVMRDAPGKRYPRKIEVVSHKSSPEATASKVKDLELPWHFIAHLHEDSEAVDIKRRYRELGYRALGTEWFFIHDLAEIPDFSSDPPARAIDTQAALASIRQRAKQPWKIQDGVRLYGVWDGRRGDMGWVESIPFCGLTWTSSLYVHSEFRQHGYGAALMSLLLKDDKRLGSGGTVLLASTLGARLYPRLGFAPRGTLQIFCPKERTGSSPMTSC